MGLYVRAIHINDHSDNNYVEFNRNGTVNTNDASQLSTHDFDFSAADFTFVNTSVSPEEERYKRSSLREFCSICNLLYQ